MEQYLDFYFREIYPQVIFHEILVGDLWSLFAQKTIEKLFNLDFRTTTEDKTN